MLFAAHFKERSRRQGLPRSVNWLSNRILGNVIWGILKASPCQISFNTLTQRPTISLFRMESPDLTLPGASWRLSTNPLQLMGTIFYLFPMEWFIGLCWRLWKFLSITSQTQGLSILNLIINLGRLSRFRLGRDAKGNIQTLGRG